MVGSLILGFFDGVHIGHRAVIDAAKELSDDCMLLTLKDSPALYFGKNKEYIYTREKSLNLIKNLGVNKIVELDFEKIVTDINPETGLKVEEIDDIDKQADRVNHPIIIAEDSLLLNKLIVESRIFSSARLSLCPIWPFC